MHGKQITCAPHEQEDLTICKPHQRDMRGHTKSAHGVEMQKMPRCFTGTDILCTGTPDFVPTHQGKSRLKQQKNSACARNDTEMHGAAHQWANTCPSRHPAIGSRRLAMRSHQQHTRRTVEYFGTSSHFLFSVSNMGSTMMPRR